MRRHYVDISGVSDDQLEMLGYYLEYREDHFILYTKKGEDYIVHNTGGKRCIFVEDVNDAIILQGRNSLQAPPAN